MDKKKLGTSINFIEVEHLKNTRFAFIKNEILKENIAIQMQYIVFLISLEESFGLSGSITYSAFKNIIISTASIVESLIHYKMDELIKTGRIKEQSIMKKKIKYSNCKELYKISENESICGIKKILKPKRLTNDTTFIELNRSAKRSGLFTKDLFNKAEFIRIARNKIHPYSLKEVDNKYSQKDINDIFIKTSSIIQKIENY